MPAPPRPVATAGTGPFATKRSQITAAAKRWRVPAWLLYGVWGLETSWGTNVATSSAGAMGDFQFIPDTAARYGYPMTNTPTGSAFSKQADAAAHYLHDLLAEHHGNIDAALRAYSGGGYGLDQARTAAKGKPDPHANAPAPLKAAAGAVDAAAGAVSTAVSVPAKFLHLITDPRTWLRLVEIVLGVALLLMGLRSFTGGAIDPVGLAARTAAKVR